MSVFEDLGKEYTAWRHRIIDDQRSAYMFARRFAEAFRVYIGAPEFFQEPFGSGSAVRKVKYVEAFSMIDNGDDTYRLAMPESFSELVKRHADGRWMFAVSTALESAPNTWPKQNFPLPLYFKLRGSSCDLSVTNRPEAAFTIDLGDEATFKPAFDAMVSYLREVFDRDPYDAGDRKRRIGFPLEMPKASAEELQAEAGAGSGG